MAQGLNMIHGPLAQRAPSANDVRAELDRILSEPRFQASERRRAFLRFVVEETLSGRGDRLKGYTVAITVFGRDETFDNQTDPVVRLEARRLRRDLDSYYVDAGSRDAVRISIPKGSYVPHFEWHEVTQPHAVSSEARTTNSYEPPAVASSGAPDPIARITRAPARSLLIVALVATVAAIAAAGWALMAGQERPVSDGHARGPAVVVLPIRPLSSTANSRYLADGISQELIRNLMRFPSFRLYTLPISFEKDASAEPQKVGRNLGVTYVVKGTVSDSAKEIRVAAQLIGAKTGQVLWTETYAEAFTPAALFRVQSDLAGKIATTIGQPYGIVNNDMKIRLATPAVSSMQSYVCVLRAYVYRRNFSREQFDPVLRCLEEAVRRDPDYSNAWAMLAWLYVDAGRIGYAGHRNTKDEYAKALQAASQAVKLQPKNTLALKVLAAVNYYMGRYDESERIMRHALELNPYDPETLAQLGWRLAARGKFDEGIPILNRAIERTVNPPGWYFHFIAIDLYLKGDYEQMLRVAERSAADGSHFSQVLIAIAAAELGNHPVAQNALEKISEYKPLARDPAAFIRRHRATDQIVDALMAGLQKAHRIASSRP